MIKNNQKTSQSQSFTLWGFVFVWGWLFSRGLWMRGLLVMLIYIPIYFYHSIVMASLANGLPLQALYLLIPTLLLATIHLYIGFKGNHWMQANLIRSGSKYSQ